MLVKKSMFSRAAAEWFESRVTMALVWPESLFPGPGPGRPGLCACQCTAGRRAGLARGMVQVSAPANLLKEGGWLKAQIGPDGTLS